MSVPNNFPITDQLPQLSRDALTFAKRAVRALTLDEGLTREEYQERYCWAEAPRYATVYQSPQHGVICVRFSEFQGRPLDPLQTVNVVRMDNQWRLVATAQEHDDLANELAGRFPTRSYTTYLYGHLYQTYVPVSHYDHLTNKLHAIAQEPMQ